MSKNKRTRNKIKEEKTMENINENLENNNLVEESIIEEVDKTVEEQTIMNENMEESNEEQIDTQDEVEETVLGIINNCTKLYIREESSKESKPLGILEEGTEIIIDLDNSTEDFYKITTYNGIEGYCVKDYVKIK